LSQIVSIGTANPKYKYDQADIASYMSSLFGFDKNGRHRELSVLYKKTRIDNRYSVIPDFRSNGSPHILFGKNGNAEDIPSVDERLSLYNEEAVPLAKAAIKECVDNATSNGVHEFDLNEVTHLITVSCTGLSAPGLEIELSHQLKLRPEITCFGVNFIGCYASFHALKIADSICKSEKDAKVLIVSVELCTLHFQEKTDKDNLLANAIFADGAAAIIITSDNIGADNFNKRLQMDSFCTHVLHKGSEDMAWKISSSGFLMRLSSYIPDLVDEGIGPLVNSTLNRLSLDKEAIQHWAIHPGGSKILEVCKNILSLEDNALDASYRVLADYGNMSSPTILFVLKQLWDNQIAWDKSENLFAAGFGPGLTMESAVMSTAS